MKHLSILLFILLLCLTGLQAQVIVVQNGTTALTTSTLDSAILLAQPNAYIYLPGNYTFSVGANITKRINLVGAGYHPDSSKATGITSISSTLTFASGSQHSTISGIYFADNFVINTSNITLTRSHINNVLNIQNTSGNLLISECVIGTGVGNSYAIVGPGAGSGSNVPNAVIQKSIILHDDGNTCISNMYNFNFNNNIFLCTVSTGGTILSSINNCQFMNNVFTNPTAISFSQTSSNNVLTNNLFVRPSFSLPGLSTNNIFNENINTLFVNATPLTPWSISQNYNLSPTSLGINAGTDGTDVGIYGTSLPWKNGGIPFNPHYQLISIPGSTGTNGQLNISIKVAAQEN